MVDHDNVEPRRRGLVERLERLGAAIDGDDQRRALASETNKRRAGWAVAFEQAIGDVGPRLKPEIAEHAFDRIAALERAFWDMASA